MNSTKTEKETNVRANVSFAAIDPYIESNIVSPKETHVNGKDFVEWGDGNAYPDYLISLGENVPTLRSIIKGTVDFIVGNEVKIEPLRTGMTKMNMKGTDIEEQVNRISFDLMTFGGFCLQVIRGRDGEPSEIYHLPMQFIRMNKECNVFYYCEDWGKGARKKKTTVYPAFIPEVADKWLSLDENERNAHASSVLFVKTDTIHTYPVPVYAAAVKACETERMIDDYHLNAVANGFNPSMIINFNNGTPTDAMKESIERDIAEKFAGPSNAARFLLSFNPNKESATTFETPNITDFGDKYKALAESCRQRIFTSFRANPNLFGIPTEGNGFANEQYEESFTLYNRTTVVPCQSLIKRAYETIYRRPDVLEIEPFSMGDNGDAATALATQLGVGGTQALMTVLESTAMTTEQKLGTLQVLFGLDDEAAHKILNLPYTPTPENE